MGAGKVRKICLTLLKANIKGGPKYPYHSDYLREMPAKGKNACST